MKKFLIALALISTCILGTNAQLTLDYCLKKGVENYPLIKRYDLIRQTQEITLSDIETLWLPRATGYIQTTIQNAVSDYPAGLKRMLEQTGTDVAGMGRFQYKIGVDVEQMVWDGGNSKYQRELAKGETLEKEAALDVELYSIRKRIESLFFGILLLKEQNEKLYSSLRLLQSNRENLAMMLKNGVAMQSDVDMVDAQILTLQQQIASVDGSEESLREMLGIFIGESAKGKDVEPPAESLPDDLSSARPELNLFARKIKLNNAKIKSLEAAIMPKVRFFAQTWYGYPGLNMFGSILSRRMSFNIMAGVRASWNLDALYTKKNSERKLSLANEMIESERDVFLFNTNLQKDDKLSEIKKLREVMSRDEEIVRLRGRVRKAAESQLRNGVIDATALLTKINDETQAELTRAYHRIEILQAIYQLKEILNR